MKHIHGLSKSEVRDMIIACKEVLASASMQGPAGTHPRFISRDVLATMRSLVALSDLATTTILQDLREQEDRP